MYSFRSKPRNAAARSDPRDRRAWDPHDDLALASSPVPVVPRLGEDAPVPMRYLGAMNRLAFASLIVGVVTAHAAPPALPSPQSGDWLVAAPTRNAGVFAGAHNGEITLDNGLIRRTFRLVPPDAPGGPAAACVSFEDLRDGRQLLRAVRPEAEVTIDGKAVPVGGLVGQPIGNYLLPEWVKSMKATSGAWRFQGYESGPIEARFAYLPHPEWVSRPSAWPPAGVDLALSFVPPEGATYAGELVVHYEMYDGLPVVCKWLTLKNTGAAPFRVDSFASEALAFVEAESSVDVNPRPALPSVHVETDFTTVAMMPDVAQRDTVRWLPDPTYTTQVGYDLKTPCVLECWPPIGPAKDVKPGETFESFRTWILVHDSTDATRRTLALGRMYRTLSPWTQENPLIFHVRSAEPAAVRAAIDQAADVGFELIIMTFGSGFDIENTTPAYRAQIKELADYAHSKHIALGGYSLLASRSVSAADDVVNPKTGKPGGFAIFGNSPCLGSAWADRYFAAMTGFFEETGCDVLEHDGSYPGDVCASTSHPGHRGLEDSRWNQWERIARFYRWCRGRGVYLNVPDWYFMNGSNKTGMGYRETNWSLPREQQEIIERQNIADGTRFKTPSMGWMFVPLTEYQGGGAAATIEPLHEHLDHYERRLQNLLGAGVQACFRGPRLYDTPETRAMVAKWVAWYKARRAILDSEMIVLRRADGRDWDGWLHVNPALEMCGLAAIYNPLPVAVVRDVRLPLRYTGVQGRATVRVGESAARTVDVDSDGVAVVRVEIPGRGVNWVEIMRAR